MYTVLIVEGHPETRDWLADIVRSALGGADVNGVGTLAQAYDQLRDVTPTLALVDLSLPDGGGFELLRALRAECRETWCVVSTILDDDEHLFEALRSGASGYLLKDQSGADLTESLKGILAGRPPLSPVILRRILRYFHSPGPAERAMRAYLSEREQEVLVLLAKGLGRSEIAGLLGVSDNTVASHIKAVYRKLNVSGRAEATMEAVRLGLVGERQNAAHP